jgi:signal transduction histidine kinase
LKDAEIFIAINYLTTSAKMTFSRRMGVAPRNYGNVFIYRNDFRVSPYGDEFADLFGLNVRKTQGHSRYIGTREIIGHIDIKDTKDMFKETSSRNNGFIENIYYDALKTVYMDYAHRPLEKYVNLIQWGEDHTTNQEINLQTIEKTEAARFKKSLAGNNIDEFQLEYFADDLNFEESNPKKQLEKLTQNLTGNQQELINIAIKKFGDLEQENKEKQAALLEKQKTIAALAAQNQNLLCKRPESSYGQQLTHHFPKVIRRLNTSISDLNQLSEGLTSTQKTALYKITKKIKRTSTELSSIKYLLLKTNLDFRSATNIDWYNFVNGFAKEKSPKTNENVMKVLCVAEGEESKSAWNIHCNALDLMMMLENFYNNAEEHSATYIQFNFKNTLLEITSNSEPIADENLERVFELGFSTKENGTGIGLDQIRAFLKDKCNLKIRAVNLQNEVNFQIYK